MKRVLFIMLMSLMFLFATAEDSLACSCQLSMKPVKQQVKDSYNSSTAIFSGEVTEIVSNDEFSITVKFKVTKSWKSKFQSDITTKTSKDSSMCGYSFEVGKKYFVYANGSKNELSTNNCSRTAIFGNKQEIRFLDRLKKTKGKSA
ncbi:MAG: hypothetical protein AAB336_13140 [Acidobacteriota bacterium]